MDIILQTYFNNSLLPQGQRAGFFDNFDRPVGTSLGVTSGEGKLWRYESTGVTPLWRTSSGGTAVCISGDSRNVAYVDALATNGKYAVTAKSLGSSRVGGLVFRYQDINNHLFLWQSSATAGLAIYKRVAGTATKIGDSAYIPADNDVYEVEMNGSNIILRVNGATITTATESAFLGETRMGLVATSSSFQMGWDNATFTPTA